MPVTLARIQTRALLGIEAPEVEVEVHIANGLPAFHIVGLPEAAVRESRDRVRSAILNSGFEFPNRRLTVNLAPADLPKDSGRFDLPIAIGVLIATGQLPDRGTRRQLYVGELSLSGELRPIRGALAMGLALARTIGATTDASTHVVAPKSATSAGRRRQVRQDGPELIAPIGNAAELSVIPGIAVRLATTLAQVFAALAGGPALPSLDDSDAWAPTDEAPVGLADMADIRGQGTIKAALEVAAAGQHNALLIGPPGSGKSMLAQRLPGILPPLTDAEALESGAVTSLAGRFDVRHWRKRAFRAPHHSASTAALVGGGPALRPGEISLAHNGVLFLDELPEFGMRSLDSLREPLETGHIALSRAARQLELPARFQLIAAMNPCPCGLFGDARCRCTPDQVGRYQQRISGPLLDRLDLHLWVPAVDGTTLVEGDADTSAGASSVMAQRVGRARARQTDRQGCANGQLGARGVALHCTLAEQPRRLLIRTATQLHWSARVFHRIQKIARTIADLNDETDIATRHVAQAIGYRRALGLIASRQ